MSIPLLSVCLITYNHEKFIRQAIEGILNQQVNFPIEIVVADDCSTDSTREIITEYEQKNPGLFRLIFQQKNVGAARNWLDMLSLPQSKYIAYLEGDDYWIDDLKLQKQVDFLEANPGYAICFHSVYDLHTDGRLQPAPSPGSENRTFEITDLARVNFISSPSVVYRRFPVKELPDWILKAPVGDYVLHLLYAARGKIYFIAELMAVYRRHEQGLWSLHKNHVQAVKLKWVVDKMDQYFSYKYHDSFYSKKFLEDYYLSMMEHYKAERKFTKYFSALFKFLSYKKKLQRSYGNYFLLARQYFSYKRVESKHE